jgi:hypothetical protein
LGIGTHQIDALFFTKIDTNHHGTRFGKGQGNAGANLAINAGDNGNFACQGQRMCRHKNHPDKKRVAELLSATRHL